METKILSNEQFNGPEGPEFEKKYDFCLATSINDGVEVEVLYFNAEDKDVILLRESTGALKVDPNKTVLLLLTMRAKLTPIDLACPVATLK